MSNLLQDCRRIAAEGVGVGWCLYYRVWRPNASVGSRRAKEVSGSEAAVFAPAAPLQAHQRLTLGRVLAAAQSRAHAKRTWRLCVKGIDNEHVESRRTGQGPKGARGSARVGVALQRGSRR